MRLLKDEVNKLLAPFRHRKIFLHGRLMAEWEKIVGVEIAKLTLPVSVTYYKQNANALLLHTTSSSVLFLSSREEEIIAKVNTFFGKNLINKINYKHVLTFPKKSKALSNDCLSIDKAHELDNLLNIFDNDSMGETKIRLASLGKAIFLKETHKQ